MNKSRAGKTAATTALTLFGILTALAAAELLIRVFIPDPFADIAVVFRQDRGGDAACYRPSKYLGYENVPNKCGANSLGLMDDEVSTRRSKGSIRIVLLGDSIGAHRHVADFMEDILSSKLGVGVDVVNLSVAGYATKNEFNMLAYKGMGFKPDLVVLEFCLNDFGPSQVVFEYNGSVYLAFDPGGRLSMIPEMVFEHSALVRFLASRLVLAGHEAGIGDFEVQANEVEHYLSKMRNTALRGGADLLVAVFPYVKPVSAYQPDELRAYEEIKDILARLNIQSVDLTGRFSEFATEFGYESLMAANAEKAVSLLPELFESGKLDTQARKIISHMTKERMLSPGSWDLPCTDYVHPNFLGHYIAASEISTKIVNTWGKMLSSQVN